MSRGTFFWSYLGTDGQRYVSELGIDVNSLSSSTWGAIKASFD